jgi:hypothetical protein
MDRYDGLLIPEIIDSVARRYPQRTYARFSTGSSVDDYRTVIVGQFANAINVAVQWIEKRFGKAGPGFPTIPYLGPQDLRYIILLVGAIKARYKVGAASDALRC